MKVLMGKKLNRERDEGEREKEQPRQRVVI